MNTLIIYHKNCNDGFCAAWIVKKYYPDAELYAASYNETVPDVTDRRVFIVDFSYKREILKDLHQQAQSVLLIDHHKTACEELVGLPWCFLDSTRSGARLTWDHFFGDKRIPWIVRYIEDRDLWKFSLPHSEEVSAWISSYPQDLQLWDWLEKEIEENLYQVVVEGKALLRYQKVLINKAVDRAVETQIPGEEEKILAVNSPILQSEIGHQLAKDRPYGVVYSHNGTKFIYSIRSSDKLVDVSEIARRNGGGGHKGAAAWKGPPLEIWHRRSTF
jgi:oligoribonuclease NrnB/cAMP/cGMP phosphodiesterase (DHH superfamily)